MAFVGDIIHKKVKTVFDSFVSVLIFYNLPHTPSKRSLHKHSLVKHSDWPGKHASIDDISRPLLNRKVSYYGIELTKANDHQANNIN